MDYLLAHAPKGGDARASDDVCRWTCAYIVASKEFCEVRAEVPRAQVAGVLREEGGARRRGREASSYILHRRRCVAR